MSGLWCVYWSTHLSLGDQYVFEYFKLNFLEMEWLYLSSIVVLTIENFIYLDVFNTTN